MIKSTIRELEKSNGALKFNYCPCCGQKGLYHIHQRYYRCRYCGFYRMVLPGQDW